MAFIQNIFFVTFLAFTVLHITTNAANCTRDEQTIVDNVYTELARSSACENLVADSGATSLDYCMNSDCLSVLSDATSQLPDCTGDDGIDRMTGLQNVLAYCGNVNEELGSSAMDFESGRDTGNGPITSATSKAVVTYGTVVAQLSVALFFFAKML